MGSEAGGPLVETPSVLDSKTQAQNKMRKATASENVAILP